MNDSKFQLKTERERVSERIIRLGKKWEAEHEQWEVKERQRETEMKIKEMEMLSADKSYFSQLESTDNRIDLENNYLPSELNMVAFLRKEKKLMHARLQPKEKQFQPFKKDLRVVDAKFVAKQFQSFFSNHLMNINECFSQATNERSVGSKA